MPKEGTNSKQNQLHIASVVNHVGITGSACAELGSSARHFASNSMPRQVPLPAATLDASIALCDTLEWSNIKSLTAGSFSVHVAACLAGEEHSDFQVDIGHSCVTFTALWPTQPQLPTLPAPSQPVKPDSSLQHVSAGSSSWASGAARSVSLAWHRSCRTWCQVLSVQQLCHTVHTTSVVIGTDRTWVRVPLDAHCYVVLDWAAPQLAAAQAKAKYGGGASASQSDTVGGATRTAHGGQKRPRDEQGVYALAAPPDFTPPSQQAAGSQVFTQTPPHSDSSNRPPCPSFRFWGPQPLIREWSARLQAFLGGNAEGVWGEYPSSGDALIAALGQSLAGGACCAPDVRLECAVCWMEDDPEELRTPCGGTGGSGAAGAEHAGGARSQGRWSFCAAPSCRRPFHDGCLREALRSEARASLVGGQLVGACPFCSERIAVHP